MKLVDAHCHLEAEEFTGLVDTLLADARAAGVVKVITAAVRASEWDVSEALAKRYPDMVAFALGIHPWYGEPEDVLRAQGLRQARDRGAAAIGEIGLDAKIESPSLDAQLPVFEAQLRIACELDLPVVMHCRGAFDALAHALKSVGVPKAGGIIHAFSGSVELAEMFMRLGLSFSMGGTLTYRNSPKRDAVLRRIYPDHFLLETDSPDILPVQLRGKGQPNVPAAITYGLEAAAETLGVSIEQVAETTTANANRIFQLGL